MYPRPTAAVPGMPRTARAFPRWPTRPFIYPTAPANPETRLPASEAVETEVRRQHLAICLRIDKYFAWLMLAQWVAAIAAALWISPLTWAGDVSSLHPHVTLAIFYGGLITLIPVYLTLMAPGERVTRLTIAVTQMLMSSLLIHLSGGRIETHFHIFGSLAFLSFYLDWQVLLLASATVAIDHFLRGMFLPYSIFGTYTVQSWRWLEHTGWVVFCDIFLLINCRGRLGNLRALTARRIEVEELLHHARFDSLTGLPNRTCLSERISKAIRTYAEPASETGRESGKAGFGCLYIDIDRFEAVNDLMGRVWGDILLPQVAARLLSRLEPDIFLARVGSDEFVAIVPLLVPQSNRAEEAARIMLRSLLQPFDLDGREISLSASIGISHYPQDGQDEAELLWKSDRAMYDVKRTGRNDYLVHTPERTADGEDREKAEIRLRRAIENKEFKLHYQPIFRASGPIDGNGAIAGSSTGPIAGMEALIRWTDPIRGNIPPSHFIPLAEDTGLIVQLGSFVLHEACKQASDWHSRGLLSGRIAVNVSSVELSREDYAKTVILTLRQHYTPPQCIELEVTETALVNDFALAERHLRQLHDHGIRISIDDFGTGYSSFGRLRQLTLDTLKIDRIFVEGVADSEPDSTVVEHIIAMAHTLGMSVVAEGVETESQLAALRSFQCDEVQGYLLSRPLDEKAAEAILIQQSLHVGKAIVALHDSPHQLAARDLTE